MTRVSQGDTVRIHYVGKLEDGTTFDKSYDREPLEFVAGGSQVIPGISQAVVGMEEGQTKSVTLSPEDAFGQRNPGMEKTIPREQLPDGIQEGDQLRAVQGDQEFPVFVRKLDDQSALVDANHPLAGQKLVFDIEVVSVGAEDAED